MKRSLLLLAVAGGAGVLVARGNLWIGIREFSSAGLQHMRDQGERITMMVIGVAHFDGDISTELIESTVNRLVVVGLLDSETPARAALLPRAWVAGLS